MQALAIKNLRKVYENGVEALKDVSFTVEKGDFFALLGPNGAGKSTTIGIITSLINKSAGTVEILGQNIDHNLSEAKAHVGVVPQEFNFGIFETVWNIVLNQAGYYGIPRKIAHARAEKYLNDLGLWDKKNSQTVSLSGGMKRRVMIARSLIHHPDLLILDEPTAGVDIELRRSMWDFLIDLNANGTTIILTTHYLEEAESLCRNIAIIDKGQIVENTSMKELLSRLDVETFVLNLKDELTTTPKLSDMTGELLDATTFEIRIAKNQSINQVFSQLTAQNIEVLSMRNKTNRLEEFFFKLVEKGKI
ncbi:MAG: ABC transporter ATP-binding protein [Spirochaetota bacterium]